MKILGYIGAFIGSILLVYVLWAAFIPMAIGGKVVERKILQNSPQYVITQRDALLKLYTEYSGTDDVAFKNAIKGQMCDIAGRIPESETPDKVLILCR